MRQRTGRSTMGKDHRSFHHRAAQAATQIVTVNVEIINTVDTNGNLVAQETIVVPIHSQPTLAAAALNAPLIPSLVAPLASPIASALQLPSLPPVVASALVLPLEPPSLPKASLPQVPQVPAMPTVPAVSLPVVPSVPPFPSNLKVPSVPAFPFSSGAVVAQAVPTTTPAPPTQASISADASITNSIPAATLSSATILTSPITSVSLTLASSILSVPSSSELLSSDSQSLSQSSPTPSKSRSIFLTSSVASSDAASTTFYGGAGSGAPGAISSPTPGASVGTQENGPTTPLETPQVVGSVVGSLAGAALILAVILLLLRRHKRRRKGALQLTDDDGTDNGRSMREAPVKPARASFIPSAFLHRFSGMSRSTIDTNLSGGERSFQRVSGRKLPSAFSEGMTSDQFSRGGTMSESSFYQDDHGIYGGSGLEKEFGKEIGDSPMKRESGQMNFRPGPARTPMIRNPDDPFSDANRSHLSPPQSPNLTLPPRGTLGRSLPSADGSRSSRFTENV